MSDAPAAPSIPIHPINAHLASVLNPVMLAQLGSLGWEQISASTRTVMSDNFARHGSIKGPKPAYESSPRKTALKTPSLTEAQMPDGAREFMASGRKLEAWGRVVEATNARDELAELARSKTYASP